MNTTTNTRGVSEAMVAELIAAGDFLAMNGTDGMVRRWEKAKAALSDEPAAQGEVLIEAVGRVERDMTGELDINWLVEDGIHAIGEGSILLCADRDNVTDDYGRATLYTAPPAQPADPTDPGTDVSVLREQVRHLERRIHELHAQLAERVPEGLQSALREAAEVLQMVADSGVNLPPNWRWPLLDELSGYAYMLTMDSPAPSEGVKGVDRG